MSVFKCKMCGGTLEISENQTTAICEYCGTKQTLPKLDDEKRANLYDRANHFRRNNEFDKAMSIYENILNEDSTDCEAYWSLVLCRYGIEYVEDPDTKKRFPTVNRAQFTSIFDDDNYKSALEYSDVSQKQVYEEEAKAINEIQKSILAISQNEEPFDVFICYKETDANGRRTQDSVLANDLYHQLIQEGFKVFFSRITLEDKLGTAYEPYIFAALNSAKVMVVLGTKPEYFNAVWVKNEWSRYLALVKASNGSKTLIPAYRDMDPYDLPDEFSHLQAQDMSKLGFMQDLIRGIKKLANSDASKTIVKETIVLNNENANIAPFLKRAFIFLEDGNWQEADEYCEKVLDIEPNCGETYYCKLLCEYHVKSIDDFSDRFGTLSKNKNYNKAILYGDEALKEKLVECDNQCCYRYALKKFEAGEYQSAFNLFRIICDYKDSKEYIEQARIRSEKLQKKNEINERIIKKINFGIERRTEEINDIVNPIRKLSKIIRNIGIILAVSIPLQFVILALLENSDHYYETLEYVVLYVISVSGALMIISFIIWVILTSKINTGNINSIKPILEEINEDKQKIKELTVKQPNVVTEFPEILK